MNMRPALLAGLAAFTVALTSCSSPAPEPEVTAVTEVTEVVQVVEETAPAPAASHGNDQLRDVYAMVLANPSVVPLRHPDTSFELTNNYSYTFGYFDTDDIPDLYLLREMRWAGNHHFDIVTVVLGTSTLDNLVVPKNVFVSGAASVGGSRISLLIPDIDHTGTVQVDYHSTRPEQTVEVFEYRNGAIEKVGSYEQMRGDGYPEGYCRPNWRSVNDKSGLDDMSNGSCVSEI